MSGDGNTKYVLTIEEAPKGSECREYTMYQLWKHFPVIKDYLNDEGKSTGNGFDWRNIKTEFSPASVAFPNFLFKIEETGTYDGEEFYYRHYFKNGKSVQIAPVITIVWPTFTLDMLK